jgi:hypothetical protein
MYNFNSKHFVRTGCELYLSPEYGGYWTIEILHIPSNTRGDVLLNKDGLPVKHPDDITRKIEQNFQIDGLHAEMRQFAIDGYSFLRIKWPPVPQT